MAANDGVAMSVDQAMSVGNKMQANSAELAGIAPLQNLGPVADLMAALRTADGPDSAAALQALQPNVDALDALKADLASGANDTTNYIFGNADATDANDNMGKNVVGGIGGQG